MRRPHTLASAVVGLLAIAALTGGCGTSAADPAPKPPRYPAGTATNGRVPSHITHLPFTDQAGHRVRLADFAGKTVVVDDIMTLCQELCPIDTATFVQTATDYAKTAKDPGDVEFVSVTVDPQRDDPAMLAAYRKQYVGAAANLPQWHLLTGSPADVAELWKYLGVYVKKVPQDEKVRNWRTGEPLTYDVEHSDQAFFIDPSGNERYVLDGMPSLGKATIPAGIERFMSGDGHRNEQKHSGWTAAQGLGVLAWLTDAQT